MRYRLSEADALFVEEVQRFLKDNLDPHLARKVKYGEPVAKSEQDEWTRTLNRQGWAAPNWPVEYGGTGWNMVQRHLLIKPCVCIMRRELRGSASTWWDPPSSSTAVKRKKHFTCPKF